MTQLLSRSKDEDLVDDCVDFVISSFGACVGVAAGGGGGRSGSDMMSVLVVGFLSSMLCKSSDEANNEQMSLWIVPFLSMDEVGDN